ncbi:hypothetical protein F4802DRAFT_497456 [Xylaria palmicola]|nr:hypothetical protein F4802DRAFT_497456 [Xylaria palmicola]
MPRTPSRTPSHRSSRRSSRPPSRRASSSGPSAAGEETEPFSSTPAILNIGSQSSSHSPSISSVPAVMSGTSLRPQNWADYPMNGAASSTLDAGGQLSPLASSGTRRRSTRAHTFRTLEEFEDYESQPGWRPGAEPGIDPKKPDGGQEAVPDLHAECHIVVVDFSREELKVHVLANAQLIEFLRQPQPSWVQCRWINVNGLSWDVIQALGKYKDLHRLAIEDTMNTRNRTKADWYAGHAFLILTCMKLVRLMDPDGDSSDEESFDETSDKGILRRAGRKFEKWVSGKKVRHQTDADDAEKATKLNTNGLGTTNHPTGAAGVVDPHTLRTLQRYHAAPNAARAEYMEKHSALASRGLAVSAEQVSMFITSDNTVISFFEQSAENIEEPILARLMSPKTILRKSCDASMVAQAIIDAIIDLAIPVTACYADIVGDLELDILTHPQVKHTKSLYVVISEINKLFSFVNPIQALISSLRDHKTKLSQETVSATKLQNPLEGVIITPVTYTYLGDVYDHCVLITENLTQIKESANHMIDLIFNTIATYQNESMKQLTIVTIIFLPLTFITGYFGQNFTDFPESDNNSTYFWKIAIPTVAITVLLLMRDIIYESLVTFFQRRHILDIRRRRRRSGVDRGRRGRDRGRDRLRLPSRNAL